MTSVVNAVDIDGSEKYLVVRTSQDGLFRLLISILFLLVSAFFLVAFPSFTLRPV